MQDKDFVRVFGASNAQRNESQKALWEIIKRKAFQKDVSLFDVATGRVRPRETARDFCLGIYEKVMEAKRDE